MAALRAVRARLTYARIMSTFAVFLALSGGTAMAAYVVSSNSQIGPDTVSGHRTIPGIHANVIAGSVAAKDLATGVVTPVKLAKSESYRPVGGPGQPVFKHQWKNVGGEFETMAFFKDTTGVVHLRGKIQSGHSAAVIFTLPPGYRPTRTLVLPLAVQGLVPGYLNIDADGNVQPIWSGGGSRSLGLDGLSFRAGS